MANYYRKRYNFIGGLVEDNPLSSGATTLTSAGLAAVGTLGTDEYMVVILDPDGVDGEPEIAYITAHTSAATTATISRGLESSTARAHDRDTPWVHAATAQDFEGITLATQEQASAGLTTATTGYTAGDTLGTGWVFTTMVGTTGGAARLTGIRVYDKADIMQSMTLFFAAASITFGTDNAAPSISDADQAKIHGQATLTFTDLGNSRVATLDSISIPYYCDATSLYVYAITNTTLPSPTFFGAAGDLPIRLFYELV